MSHGNVVQVVSFDVWKTIFDINENFSSLRKVLFFDALECAASGIDYERFSEIFDTMKEQTERECEIRGIHIGLLERVVDLCSRLDIKPIDPHGLEELALKQSRLVIAHPAKLVSNSIPKLFNYLTIRGKAIFVISNTGLLSGDSVRYLFKLYDIDKYVKHYIFSDEIGVTKPNIFTANILTNITKTDPKNILHIGDSKFADYLGAYNAGINALCTIMNNVGISKAKRLIQLLDESTEDN